MSFARRLSFALAVLLSSTMQCALAAPLYRTSSLGNPAWSNITPHHLNNLGQVVGTVSTLDGERFFLSSEGVMRTLGQSAGTLIPIDINDAGTMVYGNTMYYADDSTVTFSDRLYMYGINNLGNATGIYYPTRLGPLRQFTFAPVVRPNGQMDLTADALTWSLGYAINDAGVAVGDSRTVGGSRPARFVSGQTQLLDTMGDGRGIATAINNSGFSVGETGLRAALWTPEGKLIDLGAMLEAEFGPHDYSVAYAINSFGEVIGQYGTRGFLYSEGVMYDLDSIIIPDASADLDMGSEAVGFDINDQHQIIAMYYRNGVLLNLASPEPTQAVPEPATHLLFAAGLAALGLRQQRRTARRARPSRPGPVPRRD